MATISKRAFTLIELLIVIAIISLLVGVLIPTIDRSLASSKLANDIEVMRSKLEETRLMAGSTQVLDEAIGTDSPGTDRVGYYGLYIPGSDQTYRKFYAIVRLSDPVTQTGSGYCSGTQAANDAILGNLGSGSCLVERVELTKGVEYNDIYTYNLEHKIIVFRVPTQQVGEVYCPRPCGANNNVYQLTPPLFEHASDGVYFQLKYKSKSAKVTIEPYTGKMKVEYQ